MKIGEMLRKEKSGGPHARQRDEVGGERNARAAHELRHGHLQEDENHQANRNTLHREYKQLEQSNKRFEKKE